MNFLAKVESLEFGTLINNPNFLKDKHLKMVVGGGCSWCNQEASLSCGGCGKVYYCSREHQKQHWVKHKNDCRCYIELKSDDEGRLVKYIVILIQNIYSSVKQGMKNLIFLIKYSPFFRLQYNFVLFYYK